MTRTRSGFIAIFLVLCLSCVLRAQTASPTTAPPPPAQSAQRRQPCWQLAGVSRSVMRQRRQIERRLHNQVQLLCANSSLTAQQRHQQIQQLRQQAWSRMDALLSAAQLESIKNCRAERQPAGAAPRRDHMTGPCGEMPLNGNEAENSKPAPVPDEPVK